ncbi:5'-methylthioadenosine/S-adenosylhomocysteine nucleosidase [Anaerosporobacter faecicola]|uniref:5'-methylthioadenosine/S-adenosylhomocysteine nucleosidase n=1 Tax=Anaerosporobacter faecicola TaxID=2718714 RepID=UPI0014390545|nr:5'-methylthioadenosine/S-adenosylhomocysteine nucleosidase [Anaerosporobacter faecicola]
MKRIGLLVAVEIDSVLKSDFTYIKKEQVGKFDIYFYEMNDTQIIVAHSGAGQVKAAAATEILISLYQVEFIINFGIVGALTEEIGLEQVCVIDHIVDYTFDTSEADNCEVGRHYEYPSIYMKTDEKLLEKALQIIPNLKKVNCASGPKFVSTSEEKMRISKQFGCDIVEMEAAGILLTANMHDIGVLFIKGISDTLHGGAEEFGEMFEKSSDDCFKIIMGLLNSNLTK